MPNMQVLKFYFPIKESTIAQLEYIDTGHAKTGKHCK